MLDIDRWFQSLFDLFNSTNFQLVLLVGSGILAVSLLLLAMTHWGQSRPVWKCVVLSFVAHILLMGYAYGTRLLGPPPTVAEQADIATDETLNVSLMDDVSNSSHSRLPKPKRSAKAKFRQPEHQIRPALQPPI